MEISAAASDRNPRIEFSIPKDETETFKILSETRRLKSEKTDTSVQTFTFSANSLKMGEKLPARSNFVFLE